MVMVAPLRHADAKTTAGTLNTARNGERVRVMRVCQGVGARLILAPEPRSKLYSRLCLSPSRLSADCTKLNVSYSRAEKAVRRGCNPAAASCSHNVGSVK